MLEKDISDIHKEGAAVIYIEREKNKTQISQQIWVREEPWQSSPTTEVTCRDPMTCRHRGRGGWRRRTGQSRAGEPSTFIMTFSFQTKAERTGINQPSTPSHLLASDIF